MSVFPYHSRAFRGRGYHTHDSCPLGARIPREDRLPGDDGLVQCSVCVSLDELQDRDAIRPCTAHEPRSGAL